MIKIIKHYYVSESVYNWVRGLANWDEQTQGTYDLFVSLMTRSAWRYHKNEDTNFYFAPAYPLHSLFLKQIKANPYSISHLIETDNHYIPAYVNGIGKSKYFWVKSEILRAFELLIFSPGKHCINLYTGEKARKNRTLPTDIQAPSLYDKNKNLVTSQLVADAIKLLSKTKVEVNYAELAKYSDRISAWFNRHSPTRIDNPYCKNSRLKSAVIAANFFRLHLLKFRKDDKEPITIDYQQFYKTTISGRITEQHTGLQGICSEGRRKLLKTMGYINMDMQSAQLTCMHYLLPPGKIKDDLAKKISRLYSDAAALGFPKSLVKDFIYAYIFNAARLNYSIKPMKALKNYAKKKRLWTNYRDFLAGLSPIKSATEALLSIIKKQQSNGRWINHAGVVLTIDTLRKRGEKALSKYMKRIKCIIPQIEREEYVTHKINKTLLSFAIQGIETFIIHTLTLRGSKDTYTVINNQHDGFLLSADSDKNKLLEELARLNKEINANFILVEKPL
jgi:hypothetical protein